MEASTKKGMAQAYFACKLAERRFTQRDAKQIYFACIRAHGKTAPLRQDCSYVNATTGIINRGSDEFKFSGKDNDELAIRISEIMASQVNRHDFCMNEFRLSHFFQDFQRAWTYGINGVRPRYWLHDLKNELKLRKWCLDAITGIVREKLAETLMD